MIITYENKDYSIEPTRLGLVETETRYNYSFLKPNVESLTGVMDFMTYITMSGLRKTQKDIKKETAIAIVDEYIDEVGFEKAVEDFTNLLNNTLNPKTGAKAK